MVNSLAEVDDAMAYNGEAVPEIRLFSKTGR